MKPMQYERKGQKITHYWVDENGKKRQRTTDEGSINAAKRRSRSIQMNEDGATGLGTVRVIH